MQRLHVIGRKNHGKTTLVCELVEALVRRGWRIGTIKHTHHHHELDTPGKDSHRHRVAGSQVVGILSPHMSAVFWSPQPDEQNDSRYAAFSPHMQSCDLVLVEGDSQTHADTIEVWRSGLDIEPMALHQSTIRIVVSDDNPNCQQPVLPRSDLNALLEWIEDRYLRR